MKIATGAAATSMDSMVHPTIICCSLDLASVIAHEYSSLQFGYDNFGSLALMCVYLFLWGGVHAWLAWWRDYHEERQDPHTCVVHFRRGDLENVCKFFHGCVLLQILMQFSIMACKVFLFHFLPIIVKHFYHSIEPPPLYFQPGLEIEKIHILL